MNTQEARQTMATVKPTKKGNTMQTTEKENQINQELAELGFSMTSDIPAGRVVDGWPCISYNVNLTFKDKPVMTTQYRLGTGHVDYNRSVLGSGINSDEQSALYTRQRHPHASFKNKQLEANLAAKLARNQKVKPDLATVLHSLMLDGDAFFNAQSFEDWASEFGYDADSRKAESIYRQCDSIGRKLAGSMSKEVLSKVRELVQDL